ncbi:DEKNAAC101548 [Brettanomyces naardenensis]|uniref:DEKNAAC101548 n=1 Tax=Brettanomyces naardenensis TaxID=13370 RepID=A0A448YIH3_BRENA|nr:DEKNAAC101548 [Brettanomyces naardenensis]
MSPDLALQLPDGASMRRGFVVNCGGLPIASTWLDKPLSGKNVHYFFVSVISTDLPGPSGLSSTKLDRLSITSFSTYTAGLIIYRFDNLGQSLSPCRHILLDHGAIIELKWLPSSDTNFSLLACVFSDGTAAVIKVTESFLSGPDLYSKLVSSSVQLSLDSESLKILCCTWTSHKTLLVGTTEGCVAEFDITNPSKPLFILPLCVPSVLSMQSDYGTGIFGPEPVPDRSNNILLSSGDLDVLLLDLSNPSQLIEGAKFREPLSNIVYSALINGFIYADGTRSLKFSTVRDSSTNVKLKVYDEAPQCCSCSDYSPLVLAGCANGSVRILNVYQHLGQPLKSSNAGSLRLYKLDVLDSDTEQYRLNLGYSVNKKEELTNEYSAYENAIGVTSCSMCNSPESHNVIGCTYGGGLIVVEVLQSVVQG